MDTLQQGLTATLLLSILSFVLVLAMLLIFSVLHWHRRHRDFLDSGRFESLRFDNDAAVAGYRAPALRQPRAWLAIKSRNLGAVQAALGLHDPKPCLWTDGMAGEKRLFVAPPVSGWILVFGPALPEPDEDVDACFRFLLNLSLKLGHIQYFSANGVLNHHAWAQMESGRVLRGYAWAGKTLWNQGEMTRQEAALRMKCADYGANVEPVSPAYGDLGNSEKVHLLAARWSIDPEDIDERLMEHEWGIAGEPSRLF
jgi:hypothetical protein